MGFGMHGKQVSLVRKLTAAILGVAIFWLNGGGCLGTSGTEPPPDDDGDGNGAEQITPEIISPTTSFDVSALDLPVSVLYSVDETATDIRGFRIPVADSSLDSAPIGDRAIIATGLAAGEQQAFAFDPEEAGIGFFRVGLVYVVGGTEEDIESRAVIQVQGSPEPIFIQPVNSLVEVVQGDDVSVSFDIRDPEGNAQWRLFFLSEGESLDVPADELGTIIAIGTGNVGTFVLETESLEPGDYQLGISATDSGSSIAATVAAGEGDRILTIPSDGSATPIVRVAAPDVPMPPTITVTAPGNSDVTIASDGSFTIRFTGVIQEPGATGTIEVFFDSDAIVGNGFASIEADLPVSRTSVLFPTGVPAGTYFIGATIWDGINPTVTDYATGRVIVSPPP